MDARIKSGHDECVSRDEVEDRFKHTNFTFQTAKTIQTRIHDLAAPCARGVDESPALRGRGERRMPVAPAASCALVVIERTRVTTSTPESPGVPARNGFNGFLRALPGDRALLPPSSADMSCLSPVGPTRLRKLDASVEASGPHDFAVRDLHLSSARLVIAHRSFANPPCDPVARKTLPRPPHPHPASVTIAIRPFGGVGWREFVEMICPTGEAKYFCKGDSTQNCPTGKSPRREPIPLVSRTRCSVLPAMPTGRANARPLAQGSAFIDRELKSDVTTRVVLQPKRVGGVYRV